MPFFCCKKSVSFARIASLYNSTLSVDYLFSSIEMSLAALLLSFVALAAADPPALTWPDAYTITGSISLPYAEITEPFEAIMDLGSKMGRMNINNGKNGKPSCFDIYILYMY